MWRVARAKSRRQWATLADHSGHLRTEDVDDIAGDHGPSQVSDRRQTPLETRDRRPCGRNLWPSWLKGQCLGALALLDYATAEPFSFLLVRLDAKTRKDAFWLRFEKKTRYRRNGRRCTATG